MEDKLKKFDSLYHYTSVKGLEGIVGENFFSLWATHYSFLNDTEEIKVGYKYLDRAIQDLSTEEDKHPITESILQKAFGNEFYLTSFCGFP